MSSDSVPADTTGERIRAAAPGDIPELGRLFTEVFGEKRPEAIWRWKYFDHPRGSHSFVCEAGGRLVAHCGGTEVRFADRDRDFRAMQSVDFMSSPRHAGGLGSGGVFARTVRAFFENTCGPGRVEMVYGFPGERHRLFGERLLGYRRVENVGELELEVRGAQSLSSLDRFTGSIARSAPSYRPELGAIRDEIYLRWRYAEHPLHDYRVIRIRQGRIRPRKLLAVLRDIGDAILLMELVGDVDEPLLGVFCDWLRGFEKRVRFWYSLESGLANDLQRHGFRTRARDHSLECRFFFERPTPRPGEMVYTAGDYDVY